jgi:uncharacterized membrane protein YkvA (DUF1232 family)
VEEQTIDLARVGPCEAAAPNGGYSPARNVPGVLIVVKDVTTIGPRRIAAFRALGRVLADGLRPGAPGFGDRLRSVPRMLRGAFSGRYPELTRARLGLLLLAVAYLVSPVDLVPEAFLALLGIGDDVIVALWLGGAVLVETERFLAWERNQPVVMDQQPA